MFRNSEQICSRAPRTHRNRKTRGGATKLSDRDPESDTLRLGEAVILAQMPVRFHAQRAAILMTKPTRDRRNIHSALDANGREEMPEVVMSYAPHADLRSRVRHAVLAFEDAHDARVRRFGGTFLSEID